MKYVELMSEQVLGEVLRADEGTTTLALQHQHQVSFAEGEYNRKDVEGFAFALIRTGAIYVLEKEPLTLSWGDILEIPSDFIPPLPFPRIVIEAEKDGKPVPFFLAEEADMGNEVMTKLITISELEQGVEWHLCQVLELHG